MSGQYEPDFLFPTTYLPVVVNGSRVDSVPRITNRKERPSTTLEAVPPTQGATQLPARHQVKHHTIVCRYEERRGSKVRGRENFVRSRPVYSPNVCMAMVWTGQQIANPDSGENDLDM